MSWVQAIAVRKDYTAGEVRRFAQRAKDAAQARRLAIAAVLSSAWRLPLAGLVAFSHLQFSQIRGRQPYLIVRKIPYLITLIDQPWKIMSIARRDWTAVGHSI